MSRAQLTSTTQQDSGGAVAPFLAGKNKIINGDFRINQRNFTSATSGYCFDRWTMAASGGTMTVTPQTFTPGAAPVAGYEAQNYAQIVTSGYGSAGDYGLFIQNIEDMRTFAGQTITVSFWAKAASGTPKIAVETYLGLGSGGSGGTLSTPGGAVTISTSWARYSLTFTVPSISGATIGTGSSIAVNLWVSAGSSFNTRASSIGTQNNTFSIWGVQAENGSVATPFTTASGTLQGELALCMRYYEKSYAQGTNPGSATETNAITSSTNAASPTTSYLSLGLVYKIVKRTSPTVTLYDSSGASNKTGRFSIGSPTTTGQTVAFANASDAAGIVYSSGSASATGLLVHYTADAEL
jgi:hypothetical protein